MGSRVWGGAGSLGGTTSNPLPGKMGSIVIMPNVSMVADSRPDTPQQSVMELNGADTDMQNMMSGALQLQAEEEARIQQVHFPSHENESSEGNHDKISANKNKSVLQELKGITRVLREGGTTTNEIFHGMKVEDFAPVHYSSGSLVAMMDPGLEGTVASRAPKKTMIPQLFPSGNSQKSKLWGSVEAPDMHTQHLLMEERLKAKKFEDEEQSAVENLELPSKPETPLDHVEHIEHMFSDHELMEAAAHHGLTVDEFKRNRKNMRGLIDYVNHHTARKILDTFFMIRSKFDASHLTMTVKRENDGEIEYQKALLTSDFALLVCSSKVRMKALDPLTSHLSPLSFMIIFLTIYPFLVR